MPKQLVRRPALREGGSELEFEASHRGTKRDAGRKVCAQRASLQHARARVAWQQRAKGCLLQRRGASPVSATGVPPIVQPGGGRRLRAYALRACLRKD